MSRDLRMTHTHTTCARTAHTHTHTHTQPHTHKYAFPANLRSISAPTTGPQHNVLALSLTNHLPSLGNLSCSNLSASSLLQPTLPFYFLHISLPSFCVIYPSTHYQPIHPLSTSHYHHCSSSSFLYRSPYLYLPSTLSTTPPPMPYSRLVRSRRLASGAAHCSCPSPLHSCHNSPPLQQLCWILSSML